MPFEKLDFVHPPLNITLGQGQKMNETQIPPVHPGEVLLEDFLKPLGVSQYQMAKEMKGCSHKINKIVHGKRAVTAVTALHLSRYLDTTAELWMNLQALYHLEKTCDAIEEQVTREMTLMVRDSLNVALT